MLKKIVAVLTVCAAALSLQVQALTLECKNLANVPIAVAVSYLDLDGTT